MVGMNYNDSHTYKEQGMDDCGVGWRGRKVG